MFWSSWSPKAQILTPERAILTKNWAKICFSPNFGSGGPNYLEGQRQRLTFRLSKRRMMYMMRRKRRMEGATVRKLRLAAHQPILRRGVFNLVSSHHRPSTSLKFRVCLSSRPASHPCSSPTSRIYCAARCLGPSLCCVVLVRLGEQFILVFSSHEAL